MAVAERQAKARRRRSFSTIISLKVSFGTAEGCSVNRSRKGASEGCSSEPSRLRMR